MAVLTRKRLIILVEVVLIIVVYLAAKAYSGRNLVTGPAPPINATSLTGTPIALSDFKDRPVLVHFWASWCPVCELEQDSIQAISQDYPVISVAMQSGDELEVAAHMEEHKLDFPTIVDEHGELAKQFGVRGVPTSFILSPRRIIEFSEIGYTTEIGLRARLWFAGK